MAAKPLECNVNPLTQTSTCTDTPQLHISRCFKHSFFFHISQLHSSVFSVFSSSRLSADYCMRIFLKYHILICSPKYPFRKIVFTYRPIMYIFRYNPQPSLTITVTLFSIFVFPFWNRHHNDNDNNNN